MTKISYHILLEYLMGEFSGRFVDHKDPPERPEDMAACIDQFKLKATKFGDLPYLRVAAEHILGNPNLDSKVLSDISFNDDYAYEPEEVLAILAYLYQTVWPQRPAPEKGRFPLVEWIHSMGWSDWQKSKTKLNAGELPLED